MSSTKRISKEYAELTSSPPENFTVTLPPSQSLHTLHIVHTPPQPSPFHPGTYALVLSLPPTYPFKPPTLRFATRVYHPNVTNDEAGAVCLAALKPENWKPSTKVSQVLDAVAALMREPAPDDPLEESIADEYRNDRAKWERTARAYVDKYAMGEPKFPGGD